MFNDPNFNILLECFGLVVLICFGLTVLGVILYWVYDKIQFNKDPLKYLNKKWKERK